MKKKILFTIGMFAGGGAEKVLVNMVNSLNPEKYDITVYSVFDTGINTGLNENINKFSTFKVKPGINDNIKKNTIISKFKNFMFLTFWKYLPMKAFYRLNIREKYDIEVAYVEGMPHKIIAASSNRKSKKLAWVHIDLSTHRRARELYRSIKEEKKVFSKFEKIIFVSDYSKEKFKEVYGEYENLITKYNVNITKDIKIKSQEPIEEIKPNQYPLFVTVGRLHDQKGYDRLIRCCNRLIKLGYKFELWIIGEGALKLKFESYIKSNNLEKYVKLLGFKSNPYKYIKHADCFVASSRYEGYSTVVSEAIILGVPVIVTDCSGMSEITENGKYGILVENSEQGIYDGLKSVLDNKDYLLKYKEKSKLRSNFFSEDKTVKEIEKLF